RAGARGGAPRRHPPDLGAVVGRGHHDLVVGGHPFASDGHPDQLAHVFGRYRARRLWLPFPSSSGPARSPFPPRGAHFEGATGENTMESFEAAVALGYRYLETDTHATSDGVLVAFHDDRLDRLTDRAGAIADLPWDEVRTARVRGRQGIPRLADGLTP